MTLNRPDKLNALTFQAYADLRDLSAELPHRGDVRVLVIAGEGRGFCSGGDVEEIIGELQKMEAAELLEFTRMTGAAVKGLRDVPIPVIASIQGVAAGAGSVLALAADFRLLATSASFAFLFTKVGLAGADMGSAYLLPRIVGVGRATELLMLGDKVDAETAYRVRPRQRRRRRGARRRDGRARPPPRRRPVARLRDDQVPDREASSTWTSPARSSWRR